MQDLGPTPVPNALFSKLDQAARQVDGQLRRHFTDARSLCTTCTNRMILRRHSATERVILCLAINRRVPDDISDCSLYRSVLQMSLVQMSELAWPINISDHHQGYW